MTLILCRWGFKAFKRTELIGIIRKRQHKSNHDNKIGNALLFKEFEHAVPHSGGDLFTFLCSIFVFDSQDVIFSLLLLVLEVIPVELKSLPGFFLSPAYL